MNTTAQRQDTWIPEMVVSTLDDLLKVCEESKATFSQSARYIGSIPYRTLLLEYATQRDQFISELTSLIVDLDGKPANGRYFDDTLRSIGLEMSATITPGDKWAILEKCQCTEAAAVRAYEFALEKPMPINAYEAVIDHYYQIFRAHYRLGNLKSVYQKL